MSSMLRAMAAVMLICLHAGIARAQQSGNDVDVVLDSFGVGSVFRPGDYAGIRLQLTSNLPEPLAVQVVWEVPEGLGDIAEHMRRITLTPGQPLSVWVYARLLPNITTSSLFTVRVYRDEDGERGSELGGAVVAPGRAVAAAQEVPLTMSLIGIIGGNRMAGLEQYQVADQYMQGVPLTGSERDFIVAGISPRDIPDRWDGLAPFEVLVWTDASPGELAKRDSAARALREWIERGGHLVIILPAAGNDWGLGSRGVTPFDDLLPENQPGVRETSMVELLPLLSKRRQIDPRDDAPLTVRTLDDAGNLYQPLIALPGARGTPPAVLAVQRLVGFGRISILGIDLASGQLNAQVRPRDNRGGNLIEADRVWNRILGRRADTLHPTQIKALSDEKQLRVSGQGPTDVGRGDIVIDTIQLKGGAGTGIGLAFFLFVAYWLAAGPLGFAVLKSWKQVRHAWFVFALTSAAFTVIAWGGVKLFSRKNTIVQHLTFLDTVASVPGVNDGSVTRATTWFTVFLPGYGDPELTLASEANARNLLSPYTAPGKPVTPFRDVDRYVVGNDAPADFPSPARATTKELAARWQGSGAGEFGSIVATTALEADRNQVRGRISHDLPGALYNVDIFIVYPDRTQPLRYGDGTGADPFFPPGQTGGQLNVGSVWSLSQPWQPLTELDLSTTLTAGARAPMVRFFDTLTDRIQANYQGNTVGLNSTDHERYRKALSFFNQLPPPIYSKTPNDFSDDRPQRFARSLGREIDLSQWFIRPCIIIYGELRNSELPVPFTVNDRSPDSAGITIVRWIYPLPLELDAILPGP
ncbi:MAG: hypothetical protein ACR2GY_07525 [Phycisphaerales bacterium]